ncbi:MAG: response regulator receiver protein [Solirubrobacterales bacterium]|nr:response regulator receiver protein [Solirubrobacterales bacterium]
MSRVLVADDDPDIVALVRIRLERAGHEVVTAEDGEAAWALVLERPVDLAVLDVSMPRVDGLELTRRLRGLPETAALPILILTAAVQPTDAEEAITAGATAYVKKPFSPKALVERVDALLAGQAGADAATGT